MRSWWNRWVLLCAREGDARPLALVRIFLSLVLVGDLSRAAWLGLVPVLWRSDEVGGLGAFSSSWVWIDRWPVWGGPIAVSATIVALCLVALGVGVRPALVVAVVAYSQVGHLFPPGDRAIDRLLRTVMLVLLFSQCHRRWALGGGPALRWVSAWPLGLLRLLMVLVYLSAGVCKLMANVDWVGWPERPVLYRVLTDPLAASVNPAFASSHFLVLRLLGFGTILLELSAPLLFTRLAPWWALGGAAMHLGIAATMELGAFSWGMLALYPVVWGGWMIRWLDRKGPGKS